MKAFVVMLYISIGGSLGWWLGAKVGLMTAYMLSVVGSSLGLYLGRRFVRNNLG